MVSFSGGLLRLMMTGFMFVLVSPVNFWVQFLISEIISYIASSYKEGFHMVKKTISEIMPYLKDIKKQVKLFWVAHRSSRLNLLMSL